MNRKEIIKKGMDSAVWCTCSPHEWKWTDAQALDMARCCWELHGQVAELRRKLRRFKTNKSKTLRYDVSGGRSGLKTAVEKVVSALAQGRIPNRRKSRCTTETERN